MSPVLIRRAVGADAGRILECLRTAFAPYRDRYTPAAFADTVMNDQTIEQRLSEMTVLVAVDEEGSVVGTVGCLRVGDDEGHLRGMAVMPEQSGRGVAARLLESIEHELRRLGCSHVTLDTTEPLQRAMHFYERHGYRRSGIVSDFFGMPLVGYTKRLVAQDDLLRRVDHLVYATPDLPATVEELAERLGVRAAPGGQHRGRGTRNALISLAPTCYLEIIGPDPSQPAVEKPRWFAIDELTSPRLVAWAVKGTDLESLSQTAARANVRFGPVGEGSRMRPDGVRLAWKFTDPVAVVGDGLVPFFIDWGRSDHPAASAPGWPALTHLRGEHPAPEEIRAMLAVLDIDLPVALGATPRLIATLVTRDGEVNLE
jgi:ribosomal protein S18 acetylase RimI-like enzyme